uniref:Small ribosomal subunit protein uS3 n=1 Tax=Nanoarchaeum equitans (strain Kin4-M) TaxID=228908 RepID=RS3_NANEQ|nr:RecName: Full=Small ribosomal subunit protein uS3; AltName: Full=30S ribosomal protein S3 [Nanoarchaeum equitans Kin4-M]
MASKVIRKFIQNAKLTVFSQEFIRLYLRGANVSKVIIRQTPIVNRVIIYSARPKMISEERKAHLAKLLELKFGLEKPVIEVLPIENPNLDAHVIAERLAMGIERNIRAYRRLAQRYLETIMNAGAIGAEIVIAGRLSGQRGKTWRFKAGNLRKTGTIGQFELDRAFNIAYLKPGVAGIHVTILKPDAEIPDIIEFKSPEEISIEEIEKIDKEIAEKMKKYLETYLLAKQM